MTVRPKGQSELQLILFKHTAGKQLTDDDIRRIAELMAKGAFGAGVFETADCQTQQK